ncbi:MAG: hypothetical protein QOI63_1070 [Thermoplasmata archaeon]|jgi:hypothetical protein|nr:hypothetical protein [Thermoplasmata archaeon]
MRSNSHIGRLGKRAPKVPAALLLLTGLGLALTPSTSAVIAPNVIANGDYSLGLAGWTHGATNNLPPPALVPSCAANGGDMASYSSIPGGRFSWQQLAVPLAPSYKLEFDARLTGALTGPAGSRVLVASGWTPATGGSLNQVAVDFRGGSVLLMVSSAGLGVVSAPMPTDGLCHHYEVYLLWAAQPTDRHAWLLVDGVQTLHAVGTAQMPPGTVIIVGGVSCCLDPEPDLALDNLQFGPWV